MPRRTGSPTLDIAAHCHVYESESVAHPLIDADVGEPVYKDVGAIRRRYTDAGIDRAVLSQPHLLAGSSVETVQATNDALRDAIDGVDGFSALAALPIAAGGKAAAEEFERALDAGFSGAIVQTIANDIEVHESAYDPVFSVADRTGAPILVHPKLQDSIGAAAVLDDAWRLNAVLGRDAGLCASLCKVVHTGVLDRYPGLNLIFHHFGGNIVSMLGRFANQLRKRPPDLWDSPEPTKPFEEFKAQLEDRVYVDTTGYDGYRGVMRNAIAELPVPHLLFGTDFPFEMRTPKDLAMMRRQVVEEVPRSDAERILGGNALDLLVNVD